MPEPNLIHPVDIVLEQRDLSNTLFDEDTREPIRQVERVTQTTIQGQVLWDFHEDPKVTSAGLELGERGYILVKLADMSVLGITLKQGDRIVSVGGVTVDLYVSRLRPMGHYPGLGATIMRAYFIDRGSTHTTGSP